MPEDTTLRILKELATRPLATGRYVLDYRDNPVPVPDSAAWAEWFVDNTHHHQLRHDRLPTGERVSTVFLGINLRPGANPPLLWETVIFGGPHDQYLDRYATKDDALAGHAAALKLAKGKSRL